jgi:hypothetical protein
VTISAADLILLRDDLGVVPDAIALARATLATIRGNLAWAFGYNIAAIPLAATGFFKPLIVGAAMAASWAFVVGNSVRLRRFGTSAGAGPGRPRPPRAKPGRRMGRPGRPLHQAGGLAARPQQHGMGPRADHQRSHPTRIIRLTPLGVLTRVATSRLTKSLASACRMARFSARCPMVTAELAYPAAIVDSASRTSAAGSSRSFRTPVTFRIGSITFWIFSTALAERPASPLARQSSAAWRTV